MVRDVLQSVATGIVGLITAFRWERILRIHGAIALCVIAGGALLALAAWEWIAVTLCIGMVISAECMNTALERLADRVSLEKHPLIKQAKDCSSAAVLVLAITSGVIGGIVFVPKISAWIGR